MHLSNLLKPNVCSFQTHNFKEIQTAKTNNNPELLSKIPVLVDSMSIFREGNGTPLQYSCLENPMDGGASWAAVHGVATELDTTED